MLSVIPDASLEHPNYHKLSWSALEALHDAESLFERGRRLRNGIGVRKNEAEGWKLTGKAAHLGHPVALAFCFDFGQHTEKDPQRAAALNAEASKRGHPAGTILCMVY